MLIWSVIGGGFVGAAGRTVEVNFTRMNRQFIDDRNVRYQCSIHSPKNHPSNNTKQKVTLTGYVIPPVDPSAYNQSGGKYMSYPFRNPFVRELDPGESLYFEYRDNDKTPLAGHFSEFFVSGDPQYSDFYPMISLRIEVDQDAGFLLGQCTLYGSSTTTVALTNEYTFPINGGKPF